MSDISIEKLDQNMAIEHTVKENDVHFYDVREEPFEIFYDKLSYVQFCTRPLDRATAGCYGWSWLEIPQHTARSVLW